VNIGGNIVLLFHVLASIGNIDQTLVNSLHSREFITQSWIHYTVVNSLHRPA